ncbi:MAG: hypothetical protein SOR73_11865 [Romboutsia timonensis]|uniref:hypothetical protein n=1 Tax=Romboutsia timonensis TaxID=1776391 RepID=UPI002A751F95|nr:hypothetical protein [Romboutsia timonensis]MDY3002346.1 hypothetical protein [Romboutsia timonensis]
MNKSDNNKSMVKKRQEKLINYMVDKAGVPIYRSDIEDFYTKLPNNLKSSRDKVSSSTIVRDLRECEIKCDKENGNVYLLKNNFYIKRTKIRITNLLKDCTIYKPILLGRSFKECKYNNPGLSLYSILIKSNNSNSCVIDELYSNLLELYSYYSSDKEISALKVDKSNLYLDFVFDDKRKMLTFYNEINSFKYPENSAPNKDD